MFAVATTAASIRASARAQRRAITAAAAGALATTAAPSTRNGCARIVAAAAGGGVVAPLCARRLHTSTVVASPSSTHWDVIVVGGGHAGCEAAAAAARLGGRTLLVTQRRDAIGVMSCNPSMGGIGKGTLIREIDALGGLMGRMADSACIQFRLLNTSKGPAVHGPRMQLDRSLYRAAMQQAILGDTPNLTVEEGAVADLVVEGEDPEGHAGAGAVPRVAGVVLADGRVLRSGAVVLTTGTFLRGKMLLGRTVTAGGRRMGGDGSGPIGAGAGTDAGTGAAGEGDAEPAATALAQTLQRLNFPLARMRTGTPPRLDRDSLDLDTLTPQHSEPVRPFSFLHDPVPLDTGTPDSSPEGMTYRNPNPLERCFRTETSGETRRLVLESIEKGETPSYESRPTLPRGVAASAAEAAAASASAAAAARAGASASSANVAASGGSVPPLPSSPSFLPSDGSHSEDSNGPRYCPSLENKFLRFRTRPSHHVLLEPEGLDSHVVYPQGMELSSSPLYQTRIVRSVPGLHRARILAYGYAVEYDHLDPRAMEAHMESRGMRGLFLAGQVNGTTGYEEAGAQGVLAGINAVTVGCARARAERTEPFVLSRADALLGVLVHDLTSVGVAEPYRMFSSRAEFRLQLRADNADRRLTRRAAALGAVHSSGERMHVLQRKEALIAGGLHALEEFRLPRAVWHALSARCTTLAAAGRGVNKARLDQHALLAQLAPEFSLDLGAHPSSAAAAGAAAAPGSAGGGLSAAQFLEGAPLSCTLSLLCGLYPSLGRLVSPSIRSDLETDVRYRPFVARQQREAAALGMAAAADGSDTAAGEALRLLPADRFAYAAAHFSHEDFDKLSACRPTTVAEAQRSGISPSGIMRLVQISKQQQQQQQRQ